jgi:hypothetical protein
MVVLTLCLTIAGCGARDGDGDGDGAAGADEPTTTAAAVTTTTAATGPGDFGSMKELCGPGDASGATARGVTDAEIHVGTMGDPTNTVLPGIGQEAFDIGDAFVEWCNAAGGILGREIVLTKRDAKLFEVGARMIEACQSDFMLGWMLGSVAGSRRSRRTSCRPGRPRPTRRWSSTARSRR